MKAGHLALLLLVACAKPRPPVEAPLPAPKRLIEPRFGPALAETKRLVELLLATPADKEFMEAETLRAAALEGWRPGQAKRRAIFAQIEAARPTSDYAGAALLEGKAMESLARDWFEVEVEECTGDPTLCKIAARVASNARQTWIDRARERYEACAAFAHDDPDMEDFCSARAEALRKRTH